MTHAARVGRDVRRRPPSALRMRAPRRPPPLLVSPVSSSCEDVPVDERRLRWQMRRERRRVRTRAVAVFRARDRITRARARLVAVQATNRRLSEFRRQLVEEERGRS